MGVATVKQKDIPSRRIAATYPQIFELRALFSDMDAFRHINNGAIGRYLEAGRATLNMKISGTESLTNPSGGLLLLFANLTIDFLLQAHYPGNAQIAAGVARIGSSSYMVARAGFQNGGCFALAESILVKAMDGKPAALTDLERERLSAAMLHDQ